ncbi:septum formation family protein [Microbacterium sp. USHLN186]|uniref:septum formation family protein n=1 Tax=Microbacterium sp. USHLN186 TaxID=3081286 RepID=UPI0030195378
MPRILRNRARLTGAAVAVAALIGLPLTGCTALSIPIDGASNDERPQSSPDPTAAGVDSTDIFDLKVGDCKLEDDISSGQLSDTRIVSCTEPHDEEVYHEFEMKDGVYPPAALIEREAFEQCGDAFEGYVGVSYEESMLEFAYFSPTEDGWTQLDDRVVQCVLYAGDGSRLETSMKDAGV